MLLVGILPLGGSRNNNNCTVRSLQCEPSIRRWVGGKARASCVHPEKTIGLRI